MDHVTEGNRSQDRTIQPLRWLSGLLFVAALIGIGAMLLSDGVHRYQFTSVHQHLAAYPLMLIGLSYISLQCSAKRALSDTVKGLLLGLAFVLWGGEQLLPPSPLVTVMDEAVVTIFVVDLGLMILEHLKRNDQMLP